MNQNYDAIIIGAGAAGLFCAIHVAQKGKKVLVLDHANKVGKKILMSGGGRCNFTNLNTTHDDFTSVNPHFCKSALSQYSAYDFLNLVESHKIEYVEKEPGQLFCKNSSKDILNMLLAECAKAGVKIFKKCEIQKIEHNEEFYVETSIENYQTGSLVVATGGLSIPTLGATGIGYELARKFSHKIVSTYPSLVPFMLNEKLLEKTKALSGISVVANICISDNNNKCITDAMLFTHRGLSGPAVLKLSAYWKQGDKITIDMLPDNNVEDILESNIKEHKEQSLQNTLNMYLPKRLVCYICGKKDKIKIKHLSHKDIVELADKIHRWQLAPVATEGYRTAEVTAGGVSTENISSKTMQSQLVPGLYFIGEVLDVTGQLGGYNFQWAWSSAWCAAQAVE